MTEFRYSARTPAGTIVRGRVQAADRDGAVAGLRHRALFITGLTPLAARRRGIRITGSFRRARARVAFFRAFATLVRAGVPLQRSLEVAIARCEHAGLTAALRAVLAGVERGQALSAAFADQPRLFPHLIVAMVAAGESGGILDDVLDRVATFLERDHALRKRVAGALAYPACVVVVAATLLAFIVVRIVPLFATLFDSFHVALPLSTRALIALSAVSRTPAAAALAGGLFVLGAAGTWLASRSAAGRMLFDRVRLALPLTGALIAKSIAARFARMLGTLIHSGIELSTALDVVVPVVNSPAHAAALADVLGALREGEPLTPRLAATRRFDPLLVALVGAGEESGMLDVMLLKAADYFEADVEAAIATLSAVLEPALIVFLGAVVGVIVYSVFIPLYSLIGSVSQ